MKFIGFDFTKIQVEKFPDHSGNVNINTNVNISKIEELDSSFLKGKDKDEIIQIHFNYIIDYKPNFAKIEIAGIVVLSGEPKEVKEILKDWEAKKIIPGDLKYDIFNLILRKANIKALDLEEELNLPNHIPLPTLKREEEEKKK